MAFYTPFLERVSHLPGVEAAGVINLLPIQSWESNSDTHIAGQPPNPPQQETLAEVRVASAGYFDAMGIKLVRGRRLSPAEDAPNLTVANAVVNQAFQKKFFRNGGDPVGARTDEGDKNNIVGLVTDVRQNLYEPPLAELDWLIDEIPAAAVGQLYIMSLVVRSSRNPESLVPALREALHQVAPTVPFVQPETMIEIVSESLVSSRWRIGFSAYLRHQHCSSPQSASTVLPATRLTFAHARSEFAWHLDLPAFGSLNRFSAASAYSCSQASPVAGA